MESVVVTICYSGNTSVASGEIWSHRRYEWNKNMTVISIDTKLSLNSILSPN